MKHRNLCDLLSKEEAFNSLYLLSKVPDYRDSFTTMYQDIRDSYFKGNCSEMKAYWLNYQVERIKK